MEGTAWSTGTAECDICGSLFPLGDLIDVRVTAHRLFAADVIDRRTRMCDGCAADHPVGREALREMSSKREVNDMASSRESVIDRIILEAFPDATFEVDDVPRVPAGWTPCARNGEVVLTAPFTVERDGRTVEGLIVLPLAVFASPCSCVDRKTAKADTAKAVAMVTHMIAKERANVDAELAKGERT